jgi:type II secretory pathway pseudopilin PulG
MKLRNRNKQSGMSLIELMLACFVLVVGMLGSLAMITMAIATNGRNKFDTTGTMLAQMVIEQINTLPTNTNTAAITLNDCVTAAHPVATAHVVSVVGGNVGAPTGAALVPDNDANSYRRPGDIDFLEANPPAGYSMRWHSCGDLDFDVRWNVTQITERSRLITVSARQIAFSRNNANLYASPVTLRTISGP